MNEFGATSSTNQIAESDQSGKAQKQPPITSFKASMTDGDVIIFEIEWLGGVSSDIEVKTDNGRFELRWFFETAFHQLFDAYLVSGAATAMTEEPISFFSLVDSTFPAKNDKEFFEKQLYLKATPKTEQLLVRVQPILLRGVDNVCAILRRDGTVSPDSLFNSYTYEDCLLCLNALLLNAEDTYAFIHQRATVTNDERRTLGTISGQMRQDILKSLMNLETRVEIAFQIGDIENVDRKQIFTHFTAIRNLLAAPEPSLPAIAFIVKSLDNLYGGIIAFSTLIIVLDQALLALGLPSAQELMDMFPDDLFSSSRPLSPPPVTTDPTTEV